MENLNVLHRSGYAYSEASNEDGNEDAISAMLTPTLNKKRSRVNAEDISVHAMMVPELWPAAEVEDIEEEYEND